jgi:hypothetical protein
MPRSEKSNRGLCNYIFFAQQTDRGKDWRGTPLRKSNKESASLSLGGMIVGRLRGYRPQHKDRPSHAEHLVHNRIAYRIMFSRFVY